MRMISASRPPVLLIFAIACLPGLLSACSQEIPTEDSRDPIQLTWRYMWDPADQDLPEWQMLGRWPQDLVRGRDGELFLSDEQNTRVIHFTTDGELISIIGQQGSGPGEFNNPVDLAYDRERDRLWVGERGRSMLSRFRRDGDRFEFLDTFQARAFMIDRTPALLTAADADEYWTNGWFFARDEELENSMLQRIGTDGEVVQHIGEPWQPEWVNRGMVSRINECNISMVENDRLALVWSHRPLIQIWNLDGTLAVERYFETPEIMRPGPGPSEDDGRQVFYMWFSWSEYCEETDLLYVGFSVMDKNRIDFYALDPSTLLIVEWYQLKTPDPDNNDFWPSRLVVKKTGNSVRFYCIAMLSSGVLIIEPK
ncbi:6-bladed beta-propeller [Gemmatimonadota bacterium]